MDYGTSYEKGLITLKPERKLWQKVKKFMPEISFTRLENLSSFGTPDLLCYNKKNTFFTVELKVAKGVSSDSYRDEKLYEGSRCLELAACGLRLEACCLSLESIYEKFRNL
jgi:hypothetical protein